MPSCIFTRCRNYTETVKNRPDISFHSVPVDKLIRSEWTKVVRRQRKEKDWMPDTYTRVCSDHFHESDLLTKNGKTHLRKTSVPFIENETEEENIHDHEHNHSHEHQHHDHQHRKTDEHRVALEQFKEEEQFGEVCAYIAETSLTDNEIIAETRGQNDKQRESLKKNREEQQPEEELRAQNDGNSDEVAEYCEQTDEQREAEEQFDKEEEELTVPSLEAGIKAVNVLRKLFISYEQLQESNFEDILVKMKRKIQNVQWNNYESWSREQSLNEQPSPT